MMRPSRKHWLGIGLAVAASLGGVVWLLSRGNEGADGPAAFGKGHDGDGGNTDKPLAAQRCARDPNSKVEALGGDGDRLVLGVVADARGAREQTLKGLRSIRERFRAAGVQLVVSLGGLAETAGDIEALLSVLADQAAWPVIALPGDREAVTAHHTAVDRLAKRGARVIDGARARLLRRGGVVLGTFPGVGHAARLVAGSAGCVHDEADARALATQLAAQRGARIWLSYAPPRQATPSASDRTDEGVHVGERLMSAAVEQSKAILVLHGQVDEAAIAARGEHPVAAKAPLLLAAGAADALPGVRPDGPRSATALIVTIGDGRIRWERL